MKSVFAVLFVVFALVIVGCGKGSTGFDKPEDLATKVISLRDTMEKGNLSAMLDITYFANATDKAKVKDFFDATKDISIKMMEMAKKFQPEGKFSFKNTKIEGDKGQLIFSDDSTMNVIKIDGKWFLSSDGEMFKEALTKDVEQYKKEWEQRFSEMKTGMEGMNNMSDEDKKKMEEGMKLMKESREKMKEREKADK